MGFVRYDSFKTKKFYVCVCRSRRISARNASTIRKQDRVNVSLFIVGGLVWMSV
jgi:hypothetical protein